MIAIDEERLQKRNQLKKSRNSEYLKLMEDLNLTNKERQIADMVFRPKRKYNYAIIGDEVGYSEAQIKKIVRKIIEMV